MQKWIPFQTVTNSDGEFMRQPNKKLKNEEDCICADEFSFHIIKIFLMKGSFWE